MSRRTPFQRFARRAALLLIAFLAGALSPSCGGGGGGGGGGPTSPPPPTTGITFTPSASAVAPGISLAMGPGSTANVLQLEVRATGIRHLYGVAFALQVPGTILQYDTSSNAGTIFTGGIIQVSHATSDLVVGASLLGGVKGVQGDGLIVTLEFSPLASGSGTFTFSRNTALDSTGKAIPGVSWTAGSVQVVR